MRRRRSDGVNLLRTWTSACSRWRASPVITMKARRRPVSTCLRFAVVLRHNLTNGPLGLNSAILVEAIAVPAATAGSEQQNQTQDVRRRDIGRLIIQQR